MSRTRNLSDLLDSNGDVVSGALDNVPAADVVNDTTPQLGGDLASNGNDILFADNDKAIFGAGSDLQIYHDGSDSYISDQGTGNLKLLGTQLRIQSSTGENYITANGDDYVKLYHDNAEKLATTSSGVSVTGTCTATSFSGDGSGLTGVSGGKILQVVRTLSAGASSASLSSNTWTTVPSLSISITPSSTSSKILMFARVYYEWDAGDGWNMTYAPARNGTRFNLSSASFSSSANNTENRAMGTHWIASVSDTFTTMEGFTLTTLDSPSTTSSTTYTVQIKNSNEGGTIYYNSTVSLTNQNSEGGSSEIILMEVGA